MEHLNLLSHMNVLVAFRTRVNCLRSTSVQQSFRHKSSSYKFPFSRSLPTGVQLSAAAAAAYGVPGQTSNGSSVTGAVTPAAGQLTTQQQQALAAQGAALAQQQAGVMMQAAAYPASAVQQFQVNGQPTTIAL